MKVTQRERVLQFIKDTSSITRATAASELGCHELSSRIGELEARGFAFSRKREHGKNRYGDKVSWTRYTLAGGGDVGKK